MVLMGLLFAVQLGFANPGHIIWVAPDGNDANPGTKEAPMGSVAAALRKARELRRLADPSVREGVHIILRGGEYRFDEPIFVRPEDSGWPGSPTVIEAAPGELPVISGGVAVAGWKRASGHLWAADLSLPIRQLWINGKKAVRARDVDDDDQMLRIASIDRDHRAIYIPATRPLPAHPGHMEMVIHQMWAIAVLRVRTIERVGDRYRLTFHEPESRIEFEHPWPAPVLDSLHKHNGSSAYYLTNCFEFLDKPGEWYEDAAAGKIYYWPRPGEDMANVAVRAPALEKLVVVEGTIDRPVMNVQWKGIQFSYSTWMRPSEQGHVPLQAGMYLLDGYKLKIPGTPDKKGLENQAWIGRPPGAVEVAYASGIVFQGCTFTHLASTGLDLVRGTRQDTVSRCRFEDIGGTGLQIGVYSDPGFETHLPYDPTDGREVCHDEWVLNNLVTDCTNEDWGCVGISAGYVHDVHIVHNEVREVAYSGICVGWGWTRTISCLKNNHIEGNYVHDYAKHMYDVGGIYTLSAQPGTEILRNRVDSIYHPPYVHDPHHWFYFYFDEGSSYITVKDNWCPEEKFMHNANGPGNTWENNGPMVADSVKRAAGIELP